MNGLSRLRLGRLIVLTPSGGTLSEKRSYPTFTSEQNVDVVLVGLRRHRQLRDVRREYWMSEALYHRCRGRGADGALDRLTGPALAGCAGGLSA